MENKKLTKLNNSVVKAFQILEIIAVSGHEMRLMDIAEEAQLPTSTVLRIVNTLLVCGYLNQNPSTQKYYISHKLISLCSYASGKDSLIRAAKPFMEKLGQKCNESITLAVEDSEKALFLFIEDRYVTDIKVNHRAGGRSYLHCSAVGKIFLLSRSVEQVKDLFERSEKPALTANTITAFSALEKNLSEIEKMEYAINDEESVLGARCIARPIYDFNGSICAAIGISGPSVHVTDSYIKQVLPDLIETAYQISANLGYTGPKNRKLVLAEQV